MRSLFSIFLMVLCAALFAQKAPNHFQTISLDAVTLPETAQREFEPLQYLAFKLDYEAIVAQLRDAPREFSADAKQRVCVVALPMADGQVEDFAMLKTSPMAPALEAQHPEILTLAGTSLNIPGMRVRITVTPHWGLRAMIFRADKGTEQITPLALGQNQYYMAYDPIYEPRDPMRGNLKVGYEAPPDFSNLSQESTPRFSPGGPKPQDGDLLESPVLLRRYKFACACTGEFSVSLGGNKDVIFQKVVDITNSLNGIYERDVRIRLELIPESYDIIFLDPATDPYPGQTVGEWMNANPSAMFNVLGSDDKYDVGHVFAKYIPPDPAIGVAGGLCCTQTKGRGCSAGDPPYGNDFFSVVGQEIGHMWRSGHTFNQCNIENQFDYNSACEPGSGSTIMSYAGACGSNNITGGFALYYHACSIAEIRTFVESQEGATCGTDTETGNNAPIVSTPYPSLLYIPISTPFELSGSAVDPDGDPMTYCWDEKDLGPTTTLGNPVGDSPIFRWFAPTTNPSRTFPRIQTVIANSTSDEETLPNYNRKVTMVLVARDNKPGGGGVGMDTVSMRSTTTAGPFRLSYPNLATTIWKVGEYQTVTWDVAGTDNSLVNCKKINVRLSTDGGFTYPVMLAQEVPNVGKACIQVPNNVGTLIRIRVEAADNVFFDISNASFKIEQPSVANFSLCSAILQDIACLPAQFSTEINTDAVLGFSTPVTLSATGLPNGATATFSPNPVQPGETATLDISFPANSPEATFEVVVLGTAGAATSSSTITLTTVNNDFSAIVPNSPAYGASGVNTNPLLQWTTAADANAYDVELATNPSFAPNTIGASSIGTTFGSFQIVNSLVEGGVYYWRVRAKNDCGEGDWSATQVFVVSVLNCAQIEANDVPKNISANGTPTIESKITLLAGGQISDVNVKKVQGIHEFFKDLEVHLISPMGTDVLLWNARCGSYNGSFNISFDDGAGGIFTCPPPTNNGASKPNGLLSTFNGENAAGVWTLRVKDNEISSGGSLNAFELQICSNEATNPPIITVNNVLQPASGNNMGIGNNFLKADDSNNTPAQLTFTLVTVPQNGVLRNNGSDLQIGSQFTQADIDNGYLRFFDYGLNAGADEFQFVVSDGEGGMATGTFHISPLVGTTDLAGGLSFDLSPNPADAVLRLSLSEPLASDALVTMFNAAGQRVRSWALASGNVSLSLQIADLPDGVYAVSIENEVVKGAQKVVLR